MTVPAAEEPGVLSGALRLRNPIVAASETFGYGLEFAPLVHLRRLGGLVVKGLSRESMGGAPAPRLCETPAGMLNAVGLQNIGVRAFLKEKFPELRECDTTMVANVFGYATEDYVGVIRALEDAEGLAAEVTQAPRKAARRPLWVQLFPLVTDISAIARAVEGTGADAVTVANA